MDDDDSNKMYIVSETAAIQFMASMYKEATESYENLSKMTIEKSGGYFTGLGLKWLNAAWRSGGETGPAVEYLKTFVKLARHGVSLSSEAKGQTDELITTFVTADMLRDEAIKKVVAEIYAAFGERATKDKSYKEAITLLKKAVLLETDCIDYNTRLGVAYYYDGQYHDAAIHIGKSATDSFGRKEGLLLDSGIYWADALWRAGEDIEPAMNYLRMALKTNVPESAVEKASNLLESPWTNIVADGLKAKPEFSQLIEEIYLHICSFTTGDQTSKKCYDKLLVMFPESKTARERLKN